MCRTNAEYKPAKTIFFMNFLKSVTVCLVLFLQGAGHCPSFDTSALGWQKSSDSTALALTVQLGPGIDTDSLFVFFSEPASGKISAGDSVRAFHKTAAGTFKYFTAHAPQGGQLLIKANAPAGSIWQSTQTKLALTPRYYYQKGDHVNVTVTKRRSGNLSGNTMDDYALVFVGSGAGKYTAMDSIRRAYLKGEPAGVCEPGSPQANCDPLWPKITGALSMLEVVRPLLSGMQYQLFKAEITGWQAGRVRRLKALCLDKMKTDSAGCAAFVMQNLDSEIDLQAAAIPQAIASRSASYVNYLHEKIVFEGSLQRERGPEFDYIAVIAAHYQGRLRDRLLLSLFSKHLEDQDLNALYEKARVKISEPDLLAELDEKARELPGRPVMDFTLPDLMGRPVRLADFRGKIVFVDVWFSGCGACALYYRKVLKGAEEALGNQKDIVFVSVSVDAQKEVWKRSVTSGKYSSEHVVNVYTEGKAAAHAWVRGYDFQSFPKLMILDSKGRVQKIYENGLAEDIQNTASLVNTLKKILPQLSD